MLTRDIMQEMWPHGDAKISGLVEGIVAAASTVFAKYGLNSDLTIAHAMAQFSHECGAGLEMTENIHYTAERACQVWSSRFHSAADVYARINSYPGDPGFAVKLIDNVYGGRMGNRAGTHDGSTFIGRGLSQLTGRDNYVQLGTRLQLDLVGNPDLVNQAAHALEIGVADFVMCGCLRFAENDDVSGVTYHLNGGLTGLSQRETWLTRWKTAFGAAKPALHSTFWLQQALNVLGTEPPLVADGSYGPLTAAAVKAFQASHGLAVDGKANQDTVTAIEGLIPVT